MASLPPLASEVFAEKVIANKESAAATAAKASFEKSCSVCQKTYYSDNAYANHLSSQRHRANVQKASLTGVDEASSVTSSAFSLGEPINQRAVKPKSGMTDNVANTANLVGDAALDDRKNGTVTPKAPSEDDLDEDSSKAKDRPSPLMACLFCNYASPTMPLNLLHMSKFHGMFIPEKEYLTNTEGLLNYLSDKVWVLHECLYCGKVKRTAFGAQTHMKDRGHCMIAFSTENEMLDIGQYYDFRSTYSDHDGSDVEDEDEDDESQSTGRNAGVKLGAQRQETVIVENGSGGGGDDDDEDGWESGSSLSSVPTDEITSVPISDHTHRYKMLSLHRHHSHSDPRPHRNPDGWYSHAHHQPHAVYHDDYELHLPSGRTAGHRSLAKYYRQNLHNHPSATERREQLRIAANASSSSSSDDNALESSSSPSLSGRGRQLAVSRAGGGLGMMGVSDAKKREVTALEKKNLKQAQRKQSKYQWGNDKRGNFQKHFRVCRIFFFLSFFWENYYVVLLTLV